MKKGKSTAVTVAAQSSAGVMARFNAVEAEARRISEEANGRTIARAFLGQDGVHALLTDEHGTTLEIAGGKIAVSVRALEEE
jgi:hypothetical protein